MSQKKRPRDFLPSKGTELLASPVLTESIDGRGRAVHYQNARARPPFTNRPCRAVPCRAVPCRAV
eukprot:7321061-Prymnesium_polylepis.1